MNFAEFLLQEALAGQLYDPAQVTTDRNGFQITTFNSTKGPKKQFVVPDEKVQEFMQGTDHHGFEQRVKDYFKPNKIKISWGPMGKWVVVEDDGIQSVPDTMTVKQQGNVASRMYNRVHPAQETPTGNN